MKSMKLYRVSSLLMGLLFAYSASVQLDDHDWYFWLPLYVCAGFVNLVQGISLTPRWRFAAKLGLGLGLCLLMKVVAEDIVYGLAGFWSMDLSERVVREKIGSGLVVVSMFLQLKALDSSSYKNGKRRMQISTCVQCGMILLAGVAYGLPFVFFVVQRGQMKFDL
uniref:Transmembrane protein n=1 Tax=Kalanchoe fedtschenkoi TaxID=63787 RepID=A0A7N0ULR7_KALFE